MMTDNDGSASKESGLEGVVLPGAALAVVLVSEQEPVYDGLLVMPGHVGHAAIAADVLVLDGVHLIVLGVNDRDQEVIGDVLQLT